MRYAEYQRLAEQAMVNAREAEDRMLMARDFGDAREEARWTHIRATALGRFRALCESMVACGDFPRSAQKGRRL